MSPREAWLDNLKAITKDASKSTFKDDGEEDEEGEEDDPQTRQIFAGLPPDVKIHRGFMKRQREYGVTVIICIFGH
jgi:hypothetical protein